MAGQQIATQYNLKASPQRKGGNYPRPKSSAAANHEQIAFISPKQRVDANPKSEALIQQHENGVVDFQMSKNFLGQ